MNKKKKNIQIRCGKREKQLTSMQIAYLEDTHKREGGKKENDRNVK